MMLRSIARLRTAAARRPRNYARFPKSQITRSLFARCCSTTSAGEGMMETVANSSTGNRQHAVQLFRFNFLNAHCCILGCQLRRKTTCMLHSNKLPKVSTITQLYWRLQSNLQAGDNTETRVNSYLCLIYALGTNAPIPNYAYVLFILLIVHGH